MIRIILADDHKIVRQGLRQILELAPDIVVAGEAANGLEVLSRIAEVEYDILLLDMTMPGLSGVELIKRVKQSDQAPAIVVFSMHNEGQLVTRALKAGAVGYVTKDSDPETLVSALRKVAGGGKYIDPVLVDEMVFDLGLDNRVPHERLSDREFQIFQLLVDGKSVTSIAETLSLSSKTISTHKLRLLQKMHMKSIAELTRYAIEHQLVKL
ncbi:MAG: response regulator transcription factor [Undibacterium sp.]|uniref:response regulator n=1 Tax=Undibacterium sp. TaxID=1914977 RepID=UPI00271E01D4|nr:response regulator transcription factor [Undibacterium sp.]MDO8652228.1 response regulator transcription factor [Undibacterium sp.]